MAGGCDNDFVSSHPVLLPDPPELHRGGEIPLVSLDTVERRLDALKVRDADERRVGRQMVREMTRMRQQRNETADGNADVTEDAFRQFTVSERTGDEWNESDSEGSRDSDSEGSRDSDDVRLFPCCLLCVRKKRHKLDDVVPDRKTVETDESLNLLDQIEMDDEEPQM